MLLMILHGGGERARTDDLLRARQALSQLSYTPNEGIAQKMAQRCADTPLVN